MRFKRCYLDIESKFLLQDELETRKHFKILSYLTSSLKHKSNVSVNEQVMYNFNVKYLPVDNEIDGELIITESQFLFLPNKSDSFDSIICDSIHIMEIWQRRYQHREIGLEFFLDDGNTIFIITKSIEEREILQKYFADKVVQNPESTKLIGLMQQWREGTLTNWDYLTALNQISGRTYHDLMQYPVFPWILSDYGGSLLDLGCETSYRDLRKPIAIQHEENEIHYINNYNYLAQALVDTGTTTQMGPYHYGSHYSNSGTVLHFLVRTMPFTKLFLQYQGKNAVVVFLLKLQRI